MRKSKLPLYSQTPLDRQATLERKKAQEEERIDVLGQRSDLKAKYWVKKDIEEKEKKEKEYFFFCLDTLKNLKKKKQYYRFLTTILLHFLKQEDISAKYFIDVSLTDLGIVIKIAGTKFYGAFKPSGVPFYDFAACRLKAVEVGNTVAKLDGYVRKSDAGVLLPDGEDLKIYGRDSQQ